MDKFIYTKFDELFLWVQKEYRIPITQIAIHINYMTLVTFIVSLWTQETSMIVIGLFGAVVSIITLRVVKRYQKIEEMASDDLKVRVWEAMKNIHRENSFFITLRAMILAMLIFFVTQRIILDVILDPDYPAAVAGFLFWICLLFNNYVDCCSILPPSEMKDEEEEYHQDLVYNT